MARYKNFRDVKVIKVGDKVKIIGHYSPTSELEGVVGNFDCNFIYVFKDHTWRPISWTNRDKIYILLND